jgi:hypothetical protein
MINRANLIILDHDVIRVLLTLWAWILVPVADGLALCIISWSQSLSQSLAQPHILVTQQPGHIQPRQINNMHVLLGPR